MFDWMDRAACKGFRDTVNFFPERGGDARPAKAICAECPVKDECLAYAMRLAYNASGIWGGLSERERRRLKYGRRLLSLPVCPGCGERVPRSRNTHCSAACRDRARMPV